MKARGQLDGANGQQRRWPSLRTTTAREALRMTEFSWTDRETWPFDVDGYVFLASALEQIGPLMVPEWAVAEIVVDHPGQPPGLARPLPEKLHHATTEELLHAASWLSEPALQEYASYTEEVVSGLNVLRFRKVKYSGESYLLPRQIEAIQKSEERSLELWEPAKLKDAQFREQHPATLATHEKRAKSYADTLSVFRRVATSLGNGSLIAALRNKTIGPVDWPLPSSAWHCEMSVWGPRLATCQMARADYGKAGATDYIFITAQSLEAFINKFETSPGDRPSLNSIDYKAGIKRARAQYEARLGILPKPGTDGPFPSYQDDLQFLQRAAGFKLKRHEVEDIRNRAKELGYSDRDMFKTGPRKAK